MPKGGAGKKQELHNVVEPRHILTVFKTEVGYAMRHRAHALPFQILPACPCKHILSLQAAELDVADPSTPFDCAQLLVLLLPPSQEAR